MKVLELLLTLIWTIAYAGCDNYFLYFAYGSNLLPKRIHINNPSALFVDVAYLQDYRLDFNTYVHSWNGAVATICEDPGVTVWGVLWSLGIEDMASLDKQEGIDSNFYYATNVTVTSQIGRVVARTYIQTHNPPKLKSDERIPFERLPSVTYKKVIYYGAEETGLPSYYINYLNSSITTNGRLASKKIRDSLGPPFDDY